MRPRSPIETAEYNLVECVLISTYAYERFIDASPLTIFPHLDVWRQWYYGMMPDQAIINLPNVRRVAVSGK